MKNNRLRALLNKVSSESIAQDAFISLNEEMTMNLRAHYGGDTNCGYNSGCNDNTTCYNNSGCTGNNVCGNKECGA